VSFIESISKIFAFRRKSVPLFDETISTNAHYIQNYPLLELALDHLNQGVSMVDANGNIVIFNRRAVEYAGIDRDQFSLPAKAKDVFRAQWLNGEFGTDLCLLPDTVREFYLTGKGEMPKSYVRRRPNGMIFEVRSESLPNGGYVQTYTDITELMRAKEEAEAAARAKSDFLAAMSHEIRTPLNGVLGIAALLNRSPLSVEQRNWVRLLLQSGDGLISVINDVLDFSKLEAGAVDLDLVPSNLSAVVQATVEVVELQARTKALELHVKIDPELPHWVSIDGKRLRQVLFNLLGNAVKFTDRGSVTLSLTKVALETQTNDIDRLRFEIRDTGIGISPEGQQRLFGMFSQVDASINRRFGGTGLGLAICKKIVEAMGGAIGVESEAGFGSCFWFEIDAVPCEAEADAVLEDKAGATVAHGRKILLVEDMPVNQIVARGMLTSLGHSVAVANDGIEALEMLKNASYDLVMMDMQMPRMNGLDATRAIRAQGGAFAELPIVAMTANAFHSDRNLCLAAGMNDFVSKPIELDALVAAIRRVLPASGAAPAPLQPQRSACDVAKLAHLAGFIGQVGLREVFDDFEIDSERLLDDLTEAVAKHDLEAALASLDNLEEALLTLGFVESVTEVAGIRHLLCDGAHVDDAALEKLREAILAGWREGSGWLAELRPDPGANEVKSPVSTAMGSFSSA
jgi:signal transduction histidine kinase/DNA-binding response OmpR family regulator